MSAVPRRASDLTAGELREILGRDDPFIVEAGANDGTNTQGFLEAMPQAAVICFECDPRPLTRFKCRHDSRVILREHAISHRRGTLTFHQSGGAVPHSTAPCKADWDYSGSICKPTGHLNRDPFIKFENTIEVPAMTLDEALADYAIGIVDLLWADLQGAEARMILGGQQTLAKTRYLFLEYYDTPLYDRQADLKGLVSFLPDFDLLGIYGENAFFKNQLLADDRG
jgi:FkbM family methyltransferase